jgi:hypothetical protein
MIAAAQRTAVAHGGLEERLDLLRPLVMIGFMACTDGWVTA